MEFVKAVGLAVSKVDKLVAKSVARMVAPLELWTAVQKGECLAGR